MSKPPEPDPPADLQDAPVSRAELDAALRFVHLVETQTKAHLAEVSATVVALAEALIGAGALPLPAYERKKHLAVLREAERAEGEAAVVVADVPDKYALGALPEIPCAALLPLCRARCCALPFALSVQDLDERIARWDYARPYRLARGDDGRCVHLAAGRCSIHAARPAGCRLYDCRDDRRIWLDFDAGIPAP